MDPLYQVNLELGQPDSKSAIKSLEFFIASVRARGGKIMKIWHGNMQTETHGKLKDPVRAAVRRLKREGRVHFYIYSENFNEEDASSRYMIEKFPLAKEKDEDWGTQSDCYVMLCLKM